MMVLSDSLSFRVMIRLRWRWQYHSVRCRHHESWSVRKQRNALERPVERPRRHGQYTRLQSTGIDMHEGVEKVHWIKFLRCGYINLAETMLGSTSAAHLSAKVRNP